MQNTQKTSTEPKTQKGKLMKDKLKKAAAIVYGEKGYINTRIVDITTEAQVSEGNFYRYYANKDEILVDIIEDMIDDIYEESKTQAKADSQQRIRLSTRAFFRSIKKHAPLYNVLIQVSSFDPFYQEKLKQLRQRFIKNVHRTFEKQGVVSDEKLDYVASAIQCMVQQTAYTWCVLDREKEFNIDELSDVVSDIWLNSIETLKNK
ncbi:TetR/AcrR family transcriptional regulator [Bacillus sp. B15-48]|uniref:TetR/AcrR family transcriptional regulator n=1 Tax=Bacillus sp. B15-48 TaxID=1548601 RepID=UPI00193EDC7C|nr:TetR/AcrR family transcriptional regulator [Bacillus sp. B15-48]MBM4763669.1 TetR family transcriptional regulator [Bacillus sp. B15-48]